MISYVNLGSYLGLCFLSISFLVFMSATQPFVLREVLSVKTGLGDKAGVLSFADEALAIVLSPLWGALSDKIGTRPVATIGVLVLGISLLVYTTAKSVYPDLLFLRLFFSVGGSACTAMITAILAEMTALDALDFTPGRGGGNYPYTPVYTQEHGDYNADDDDDDDDGEEGFDDDGAVTQAPTDKRNGKLSGLVGTCTGLGAVAAVTLLLPLPTQLGSLPKAYYLVGSIAILSSFLLYIGLYKDRTKNLKSWIGGLPASISIFDEAALNIVGEDTTKLPYNELIRQGFASSFDDSRILIGYIGGFVARSSSVLGTLFIPLFVNMWFYREGKCRLDVHDPSSEIKKSCRDAYILASILSGICSTATLVFAPVWGLLSDWIGRNISIILSALLGFIGSVGFAFLNSPRQPAAYVMSGLLGAGQIGAIVLSMSMVTDMKRIHSGAIAGVYSLYGGLGILILSLCGGILSDTNPGAPFAIMSVFYAVWIVATVYSIRDKFIGSLVHLGRRISNNT